MRVIGTAGHVDHGKSTLVAALTGIHPDRLKEEQAREMTIDLGFAWMELPGGEPIGIVDVPGHRDFIENMLSGVGGIDAVLFVIAADEGVMPQTREHLSILDLLQIEAGVIVMTKTDLVSDPEWLDLIETEIRQAVQGTVLEIAPVVRVSAVTGAGINDLVATLEICLLKRPIRPDLGRPRLPIDRVFTISGFGTVVTGTLVDGHLNLADEIEILPSRLRGRIRGLQSHKHKEQVAVPGSRTAVNITGLEVDQIRRGDVLTLPGKYQASRLFDVYFRLLPDTSGPLRHSSEVKLFIGAAEILARVRLLGVEELIPGQEGWLQLELREPSLAVRGDHYILRRPSPGETLGGGIVIDPHPKGRYRRFASDVIHRLESLRKGTPSEILLQAFQSSGPCLVREAVTHSRMSIEQANMALAELTANGELIQLEEGNLTPSADLLVCSKTNWFDVSDRAVRELETYHGTYPLRRGMPREQFKNRLKINQNRLFNAMVRRWVEDGWLEEGGSLVWKAGHSIRFSAQQNDLVNRLMNKFSLSPFAPPSIKETQAEVGDDIYTALVDLGLLQPVSTDVVFRKQDYDQIVSNLYDHFQGETILTAAQFRDRLNTSRRYVLGFLEYMDALGVTVREGDVRKLRKTTKNS